MDKIDIEKLDLIISPKLADLEKDKTAYCLARHLEKTAMEFMLTGLNCLDLALNIAPSKSALADALQLSNQSFRKLVAGSKPIPIHLFHTLAEYVQWMTDPDRIEKEPKVFLTGDIKFMIRKRHYDWLAHSRTPKTRVAK